MKTQITNSLKVIVRITFVAALVIVTSCGSKQETEQGENDSVSKAQVDPPEIDIHTAVLTGNIDALKQHIAAGTDLNEKDPFGGSSPLISAALFGKIEEAKILIEAGADLNFQNNDGATALHVSSFFCRPEIVKLLLDKGADKSIRNKFGATAYESVVVPFNDVKNTYEMMGKILAPMGLKLDFAYLEKTRPEIAAMLK